MGRGSSKVSDSNRMKTVNNPLVTGISQSEQKEFYYHIDYSSGNNMSTGEKTITDKGAITYDNILVNIDFPEMSGSEKQIAYAKSLATKAIVREINAITNRLPGNGAAQGKRDQRRESAIDALIQTVIKSGGNAGNLSDVVNFTLQHRQDGVLWFMKKHPSAKEIIEKYK